MARRIAGLVGALVLLATATAGGIARAADPLATASVDSGGQTNACTDQQHSGVNPGTASPTGLVQILDSSCPGTTTTPSGGAGTSAAGSSGGGGAAGSSAAPNQASTSQANQSATSQTKTASTSSTSTSATATRHAAGFTGTASVSAASARGLKIARIHYQLVRVKHGKRIRVLVTLGDGKRRPIRFAIVSLGRLAGAKTTLPRAHMAFTNRKGQAGFIVSVTKAMLGRRLMLQIGAHTPHARKLVVGAVVVPKKRPTHGALRHVTYE